MASKRLAAQFVIGLISVVTLVVLMSQVARASCVAALPLKQAVAAAPLVFVGKVTSTSNAGRTAVVRVTSVWKGPNLPRTVTVQGSLATELGAVTSVDRHYRAGRRYLFVPPGDQSGGTIQDNACSSTVAYSRAVAKSAR